MKICGVHFLALVILLSPSAWSSSVEGEAADFSRLSPQTFLEAGAPLAQPLAAIAVRGKYSARAICRSGKDHFDQANVALTFMQISDLHIGAHRRAAEHLKWIVRTAVPAVNPAFTVATGDLTDSTNGGLPLGPFRKEWTTYSELASEMPAGRYYECPGNHDHFRDKFFSYFLQYSRTKALQQTWSLEKNGKLYQFMTVNTAANDGKACPSDHAGLDESELAWIRANINPKADLIFFFGHHPLRALTYGGEEFLEILSSHNNLYFSGHTHIYAPHNVSGGLLITAPTLGKRKAGGDPEGYLLAHILNDGDVCVVPYEVGELPQ